MPQSAIYQICKSGLTELANAVRGRRRERDAREFEAQDHFSLGDSARARGDWVAAAASYGAGLRRSPAEFGYWVQYGHALKEGGDLNSAGVAYKEALTFSPNDADLYVQLGHFYRVTGDPISASRHYRHALRLGSSDIEALKGAYSSFAEDSLAAALSSANDPYRPLVASGAIVRAIYLLLLGRAPSPQEVSAKIGAHSLDLADQLIASGEFRAVIIAAMAGGDLPHARQNRSDWWVAVELLPFTGLLPSDILGTPDVLEFRHASILPDLSYIYAIYWEILWRSPDVSGKAFNAGRLEAGMLKEEVLMDLRGSAEAQALGRHIELWERSYDGNCDDLAVDDIYRFAQLVGSAPSSDTDEEEKAEIGQLLVAGEISKREALERVIGGNVDPSRPPFPSAPAPIPWGSLVAYLLERGPLNRFLGRHHGDISDTLTNCLRHPELAEVPLFRGDHAVVTFSELLTLPAARYNGRLSERSLELYVKLAKLITTKKAFDASSR